MKIKLLTAIAMALSLSGYAQTKGTSTLGLGVNSVTQQTETMVNSQNQIKVVENKSNSYSLGYGLFIEDNSRLGIDLNYGKGSIDNDYYPSKSKNYGINVSYQHYYPLVKTLYAYAAGRAGYSYYKQTVDIPTNFKTSDNGMFNRQYAVGVYGGLTWFVSKRFAFETTLLSANAAFTRTKQDGLDRDPSFYKSKQNSFNLSTDGLINNLGFKIYLLF